MASSTRYAATGDPILVFTGGDPLMRRDVFDLLSYAVQARAAHLSNAHRDDAGYAS